jgi:riboflavin transport system substrate-binding protein
MNKTKKERLKKMSPGKSFPAAGLILLPAFLLILLLFGGCGKDQAGERDESRDKTETEAQAKPQAESFDIAVFIPGAVAGSPLYQQLADGAQAAAEEYEFATAKTIEGGFNQGEWLDKVTELAASQEYELIVSSNPALPEICAKVANRFPQQKFLLFDGYLEGNDQIYTFRYEQREQAFLAGHMAGLISTAEDLPGANEKLRIGLVAGQEYPDMNDAIKPAFLEGARTVEDDIELDFRVVGNWYDASKAYELAKEMISTGVDVILPISGGANQGVLKAAEESGIYLLWYDSNGYDKAPGTILGSTAILQEKAAYEKTKAAIEGKLVFGKAVLVGVEEGWIRFIDDDPLYLEQVPRELRERQAAAIEKLSGGE